MPMNSSQLQAGVPAKSACRNESKASMMFPLVCEGPHDPDTGQTEKSA